MASWQQVVLPVEAELAGPAAVQALDGHRGAVGAEADQLVATDPLDAEVQVRQVGGADPDGLHAQELTVARRFLHLDQDRLTALSANSSHLVAPRGAGPPVDADHRVP